MLHARRRVAAVGRAWIAIIQPWRRPGCAVAGTVAGFVTVAEIAVGASCTGRLRVMLHPGCRVAAVGRAWIAVIQLWRHAILTESGPIAEFFTVACIAVAAGCPIRRRQVTHAADWVAAVVGTGVAIVDF
jgi:hypothetical protein